MAVNQIIDNVRVRERSLVKQSTFILKMTGCIYVKLCQQDSQVEHSISFKLFIHTRKNNNFANVKLP